jgi:hypothetical protein
MNEPQDHLAKGAVQRETEAAETATVSFVGLDIEIPAAPEDWPLEAMEALEQGQALKWAKLVLGADDWNALIRELRKQNGREPTMRDLNPLMEQVAETYGFESPGN